MKREERKEKTSLRIGYKMERGEKVAVVVAVGAGEGEGERHPISSEARSKFRV